MNAPRRAALGRLAAFFRGAGEILAFVLTAIGALAYLLVGHWDVERVDENAPLHAQGPDVAAGGGRVADLDS